MSSSKPFEGRVALVTGSGRGIGRAIVRKLAAEGAKVVVNDIESEPVDEVLASVRDAGGVATPCVGSIRDADFPDRFVGTALDEFGRVDIVVNNAGFSTFDPSDAMPLEDWELLLDIFLTSPFRILQRVGKYLDETADDARTGPSRRIINISSLAALMGSPTQLHYAAGKAGLLGMTYTLANEWGSRHVTVNAIAPFITRTRLILNADAGGTFEIEGRRIESPGMAEEDWTPQIPVGRIGEPEDIAGAVYLLCRPEADYISGQVLQVDGGWRPGR